MRSLQRHMRGVPAGSHRRQNLAACAEVPGEQLLLVYIPHNLLDPVMEANCAKLCQFYAHTFWANKDVFLCCQAALALAKRGLNIDRCFIGESPGGVGQSLYSLHLDTMLGNNHGFFDPNVWYNEDVSFANKSRRLPGA